MGSSKEHPPIPSRHRLWLRLGRYLIVFEPPTFVLDRRKHPWQTLWQQFVFRKSKNFTSDNEIRMPPTAPIGRYSGPTDQRIGQSPISLFHANMFRAYACFEHPNLLKVTAPTPGPGTVKPRSLSPAEKRVAPVHTNGRPTQPARKPTTSFLTAAT